MEISPVQHIAGFSDFMASVFLETGARADKRKISCRFAMGRPINGRSRLGLPALVGQWDVTCGKVVGVYRTRGG